MVDYVRRWNEHTEIPARQLVHWLGIGSSKFHDWKDRYGKRNEHNGWVPRDWWLEDWERQAIIRFCGITHVRTSPYYPQSNGKLERFHGSIKGECIRPGTPISLEDAIRVVGRYVEHYNQVRLHSAIGYIAPADKLAGREVEIFAARDRKLTEACERRKEQRKAARLRTVA